MILISCAWSCACCAFSNENGAIPPGMWHPAHFAAKIGATSAYVGAAAPPPPARGATAKSAAATAAGATSSRRITFSPPEHQVDGPAVQHPDGMPAAARVQRDAQRPARNSAPAHAHSSTDSGVADGHRAAGGGVANDADGFESNGTVRRGDVAPSAEPVRGAPDADALGLVADVVDGRDDERERPPLERRSLSADERQLCCGERRATGDGRRRPGSVARVAVRLQRGDEAERERD